MISAKIPNGRHLAFWVTLMMCLAAGLVSICLCLVVLLDPSFKGSGILTLKADIGTVPNSALYALGDRSFGVPVPDPIETIVASATAAVGSVASEASSAINSATAAVGSIEISAGLESLCLEDSCHQLPLDMSSLFAEPVINILGDSLQSLQTVESILVSAILGTIRRSLIAGVALVIIFGAILVWQKNLTPPWKRTAILCVGIVGLLIPFLISTVTVFLVEAEVRRHLPHLFAVEHGNTRNYCVAALVCAAVMAFAGVGIVVGSMRHARVKSLVRESGI